MHSTSSWYLPNSASLQSWRILTNIALTPFARIWTEFDSFSHVSQTCQQSANMATGRQVYSKRIYCKRFRRSLQLPSYKLSFVSCMISSWKMSNWSNPTRPNGRSKFQVLLHDFPSLRQQCQETCIFYCTLQEQKEIPEGRAALGTKFAPETASFCRWILTATCSLLLCFREDFLIRQLVRTSFFFMRRHGCNRHTWLTWAKENWRRIGILQVEFCKVFQKDEFFFAKFPSRCTL